MSPSTASTGTTAEVAAAPPTLIDVLRLSTTYLGEHGSASARLDSELLCAQALGLSRIDLYLQFDRPLDEQELTSIRELVRRRAKGEPVAYITGVRELYGRRFTVTRDVLVPRPETETLVERAVALLRGHADGSPRIADLGTGSGCIAITLAAEVPGMEVVASDISGAALEVARANAQALDVAVSFVECSWADLIGGRYDLVVSNPPYVTTAELEAVDRDVRDFEPHGALLGGDDGLDAYRDLIASVRDHLTTERLMLEVDPRHAGEVAALVSAGFPGSTASEAPDLTGRCRILDVVMP